MENIARLTASPRSGALPALAQHTTLLPRRHAFSTVADFALPLTPRAVKVVLAVESISGVIYLRCIQAVRLGEDEER